MPCERIETPNGPILACSRGRRQRKCYLCGAPATVLCDHPNEGGRTRTCSRACCPKHSVRLEGEIDHCQSHAHAAATGE